MKKLLGYEICIFEREGTLLARDNIVLIRRQNFSEIFYLDTLQHEIGDIIPQAVTRSAVYQYIADHGEQLKEAIMNT